MGGRLRPRQEAARAQNLRGYDPVRANSHALISFCASRAVGSCGDGAPRGFCARLPAYVPLARDTVILSDPDRLVPYFGAIGLEAIWFFCRSLELRAISGLRQVGLPNQSISNFTLYKDWSRDRWGARPRIFGFTLKVSGRRSVFPPSIAQIPAIEPHYAIID